MLEIGGAHPGPHGHREEVDDFFRLVTKQVCSKNAIRAFLDENLEPGILFPDPAR